MFFLRTAYPLVLRRAMLGISVWVVLGELWKLQDKS